MKKILCLGLSILLILSLTACEKMDTASQKEEAKDETPNKYNTSVVSGQEKPVKMPTIMSDDTVMPTYFDISLYDEENYADLYLGKDFEYNIVYCGGELALPLSFDEMISKGWALVESEEYDENAQILTGRKITVDFVNQLNKKITAVFYNDKENSVSLKESKLVKFIIKENTFISPKSEYGEFMINGITGGSAITDLVQILGAPSHFYRVGGESESYENVYYLDWFLTEDDKRSCITFYVDVAEDDIKAVEISYY